MTEEAFRNWLGSLMHWQFAEGKWLYKESCHPYKKWGEITLSDGKWHVQFYDQIGKLEATIYGRGKKKETPAEEILPFLWEAKQWIENEYADFWTRERDRQREHYAMADLLSF